MIYLQHVAKLNTVQLFLSRCQSVYFIETSASVGVSVCCELETCSCVSAEYSEAFLTAGVPGAINK